MTKIQLNIIIEDLDNKLDHIILLRKYKEFIIQEKLISMTDIMIKNHINHYIHAVNHILLIFFINEFEFTKNQFQILNFLFIHNHEYYSL